MKKTYERDLFFYILIRSWNAFEYFDRCIDSVLNQTYKNYQILFVDDASNYTIDQRKYIEAKIGTKNNTVRFNKKRKYSLRNAYEMINTYAMIEDAVIVNLDGDDWLLNENVLKQLKKIYEVKNCSFTYGECLIWDGLRLSDIPARQLKFFTNISYPKHVVEAKSFRSYPFLPLHLRTWKVDLFKSIPLSNFQKRNGEWISFCEDLAIYFPMLENTFEKCEVIKEPLYVYNCENRLSDSKVHMQKLIREEIILRKKLNQCK